MRAHQTNEEKLARMEAEMDRLKAEEKREKK
jgi:hypothetical protein